MHVPLPQNGTFLNITIKTLNMTWLTFNNRLDKEKAQLKGELDDVRSSVDHVNKEKVFTHGVCVFQHGIHEKTRTDIYLLIGWLIFNQNWFNTLKNKRVESDCIY